MAPIPDRLKRTFGTVIGTVGSVVGAFTMLGTLLDALDNPLYRWLSWAAAVCCFTCAFACGKTSSATIVDRDGQSVSISNPWRPLYLFVAMFFFVALCADATLVLVRGPVTTSGFRTFDGTVYGYTVNSRDNFLIKERVANINPIQFLREFNSNPFNGVNATALVQRVKGNKDVLFHRFLVKVVRFEEIPQFEETASGAGFIDAVDAAFLLRKEASEFPWVFTATHVRATSKGIATNGTVPFAISDSTPVAVRYFVNAKDPGIYWVKCFIEVGNGIASPKEIELTENAIPLAYYTPPPQVKSDTIDFAAFNLKRFESIERELKWLTDGAMVHVPENEFDDRDEQISMLQNERKRIMDDRQKAQIQTTPAAVPNPK